MSPPPRKGKKKKKLKEIPTKRQMSKPQTAVNVKRVTTASAGDAAAGSRCWVWKHCPLLVKPTTLMKPLIQQQKNHTVMSMA